MQDIHTHLYWHTYDADRDDVMARARAAGVREMLVVGCTVEESRQAVTLAEQYEEVYAAVGIHPQEFVVARSAEEEGSEMEALKALAKHPKAVAIGECGLEYYLHKTNNHQQITENQLSVISEEVKAVQKQGFLAQIDLAQELGLPLIVHCRASTGSDDAYRDLWEILKAKGEALQAVILHCYMGDTEVTRQFLTLPTVFFSFTGNITYPIKKSVIGTRDDLTETVKLVPLHRIFAETDCPFLAPQSKRGERNEPAYINEVVKKIAELHGKTFEEAERIIEENFKQVFRR